MEKDAQTITRERDLAWAEALTGLGRVAIRLANNLKAIHENDAAPASEPARLPASGYGPRQLNVLALRGLDTELGLAAKEVATATGLSDSNATTTLGGLTEDRILERVPGQKPLRWRRVTENG